jgi:hypothetical protein
MSTLPAPVLATPPRWGGVPLTLALLGLLVLWLVSPVGWILVSSEFAPESGTQPTPEQYRTMGIVNLCELAIGVLVPLAVLVVAWLTRRRLIAVVAAAALLVPNLLLVLVGAPVWALTAEAVNMIVTGTGPGSTV